MKFRVIHQKTPSGAHSPYQVVEQPMGRGVGWINRFLDREYVRRLADKSLYSYAHSLLYFVRWWESVHHTANTVIYFTPPNTTGCGLTRDANGAGPVCTAC